MKKNSDHTLEQLLILEMTKEVIRKHGFFQLDIATMSSIRFAAKKLSKEFDCVPEQSINLDDLLESHGLKINSLYYNKIHTVGDLIKQTPYDLLKLRNFGRGSLIKVKDFLEKYNLKLK